ncbi:MAG: hypothetical protein ACMUEM_03180 [Flavobacteriales bacterium AspAUS03]
MCIQKAHDLAKMNTLEMKTLKDIFFKHIIRNLPPEEKEKLSRIIYFNKNLTNIRYCND